MALLLRFCGIFWIVTVAAAQAPFEYVNVVDVPISAALRHRAFDVVGTPHPEVVVLRTNATIDVVNRHAPVAPTGITLALPANGQNAAAADLNGDGARELLVIGGSPTAPIVSVFSNLGQTPVRTDFAGGQYAAELSFLDFDGDGDLDFINGATLFLNGGNLAFVASLLPFSIAGPIESLVGDFDGDGDSDIVGFEIGGAATTFKMQVLRIGVSGTVTPRNPVTVSGSSGRLRVADFDGNGRDDVVVLYWSSAGTVRIRVYLGTASASLSGQTSYEICGTLASGGDLEVGDLNGDGAVDLVAGFMTHGVCTPTSQPLTPVLSAFTFQSGGAVVPLPGKGFAPMGVSSLYARFDLIDENLDGDPDLLGAPLLNPLSFVKIAENVPATAAAVTMTNFGQNVETVVRSDWGVSLNVGVTLQNGAAAIGHVVECSIAGTATATIAASPRAVVSENGTVAFNFTTGSAPGSFVLTLTTADGGTFSRTYAVDPVYTIVSGGGQTVCAGGTSAPLVVHVAEPSGVPIVGATVAVGLYGSGPNIGSISTMFAVTDAAGNATVVYNAGTFIGPVVVRFFNAGLIPSTDFNMLVTSTAVMTMIGGDGQTTGAQSAFPSPIAVRVDDCSGNPLSGFPVTFAATAPGAIGGLPATVLTDAFGIASRSVSAGAAIGPLTIVASAPGTSDVTFHLTVAPLFFASIVRGQDQVTNAGQPFAIPLEVEVRGSDGQPAPGILVAYSIVGIGNGTSLSAASALTGPDGKAQISAAAAPNAVFGVTITATPTFGVPVEFNLFVRRLIVLASPTTTLLMYAHEHGDVPLTVAVDAPLPAPGYVSTSLGNVFTSILSPGPSLFVLDGLGVLGPIDGTIRTSVGGTFIRSAPTPSVPLGVSYVVEVYGYDPAYLGLDAYFISNAAFVNL